MIHTIQYVRTWYWISRGSELGCESGHQPTDTSDLFRASSVTTIAPGLPSMNEHEIVTSVSATIYSNRTHTDDPQTS